MGQIIRFPIIVVDEKASEAQPGITPQLRSTVRPLSSATTEDVASEAAIRKGIDTISISVCGENNNISGLPVFNDITGNNVISYHSLSGMGVINVDSDSENIYINTTQTGNPGEIISADLITKRTVNGGIEQEASKINYSDFDATTGVGLSGFPAFHNVEAGDVIGKILIKCSEAFDDDTTMFSIGTYADPIYYTKKFSVSGGVTTNKLVDFEYGSGLYDKVEYIEKGGGENNTTPFYAYYNAVFHNIAVLTLYNNTAQTFTIGTPINQNRRHGSGFGNPVKHMNFETQGYNSSSTTVSKYDTINTSWSFVSPQGLGGYYASKSYHTDNDNALCGPEYSNNTHMQSYNYDADVWTDQAPYREYGSSMGYYCASYGIEGGIEHHFHYGGGYDLDPAGGNANANTEFDFKSNFTQTERTPIGALDLYSMHGQGCDLNNDEHCYVGGVYTYDGSVYPTRPGVHIYNNISEIWYHESNINIGRWKACSRTGENEFMMYINVGQNTQYYNHDTQVITTGPLISTGNAINQAAHSHTS